MKPQQQQRVYSTNFSAEFLMEVCIMEVMKMIIIPLSSVQSVR